METLGLRKQIAIRKIEETLWIQPNIDRPEVEKLSDEIAELLVKLQKEHNHYLVRCLEEFDDKDWTCPGGGW
jgi:hypothetical protein